MTRFVWEQRCDFARAPVPKIRTALTRMQASLGDNAVIALGTDQEKANWPVEKRILSMVRPTGFYRLIDTDESPSEKS